MNIQELVREHYTKWQEAGQFVFPDLADSLDFMMTEAAEAIDKRLRLQAYVRNNPEADVTEWDIAIECFDTIMMACITLDILGFRLGDVAIAKLTAMDKKRGV